MSSPKRYFLKLEPTKTFLHGLESSARVIEPNGRRIGYVHVWCYAGSFYQRALEHLLSEGVLKDADALIWDLRDGWGGAQPEYLDLFNAATAFLIGGGLLLLAVEDVRVDGERLEGVGVTPTIEVQAGAASAGSDDPQLSRAVAVLSGS
jgi:C-terminal processing protease CtpA/Prc